MTPERAYEFVDANVLVYAFDESAGPKKAAAERLLTRLWNAGTACVSVQVLQEFFVTATRKVASPMSVQEASDRIREFSVWKVFTPGANDVLRAITLHARANLS